MLQFDRLAIRRGGRQLFNGATFTVPAGERVGVIGANGCGKSSLFELILGSLEADEGHWSLSGNPEIAHVAQELESDARDAVEHVLDGDFEYRDLLDRLDGHDGHAQQRFEAIDGYSAPARAAQLLSGLGFSEARMRAPANTLSGGWRMRISLARALMCRSDLLLLDEPTNHLDLDAVLWLEDWLLRYPGTLLLISHDREFIDRICTAIASVEQGTVNFSSGNYSDYETRRSMRLAQQQAAYEKQQREIRHMHSFVDRFRAKATKAKQAQSRLKALERLEKIAPAHVDSPFHFEFKQPEHLPDPVLRLDEVSLGYGKTTVLSGVNAVISPGDRIGLLGLNGAGKSTLSRLLAGLNDETDGIVTRAKHLKTGYFAQEQLELLDPALTPAEHFKRDFDLHDEQIMRNYLGGFGFSGDRVFEKVAPFSGGEKARLVLAMVVFRKPNLLILDEPTNHLDIDMRHALTVALQSFEGALVLVSHDRHLLRAVSDRLWLVDAGCVREFDRDLDYYPKWLAERKRENEPRKTSVAAPRRDTRKLEAQIRQQLAPLKKSVSRHEAELDTAQSQLAGLDEKLANPSLYDGNPSDELKKLLKEQGETRRRIEEIEVELLEAMELLESEENQLRAGSLSG